MNGSRAPLAAAVVALGVALSACKPEVQAPDAKGVCWHMVAKKSGGYQFYEVGRNVADIEHCAAELERMRLHFVALGGTHTEIAGAYQGEFIFVEREGISAAASLNKSPYMILSRTADGRLVAPGSR